MTRKTNTAPAAPAEIEDDVYYNVVLRDRAVLPHETLPVREAPYEMRGRLLKAVFGSVETYAKVD